MCGLRLAFNALCATPCVLQVLCHQGLVSAFNLLDIDHNHRLSKEEYTLLLNALNLHSAGGGELQQSDLELTFGLLDADKSNSIDVHEFIEATTLLTVRVPRMEEGVLARIPWATWRVVWVQRIVEHRTFELSCDAAVLAYIVLLLVLSSGAATSEAALHALSSFDVAFVLFFTLELFAKVIGLSLESFWQDYWNRVDLVIVSQRSHA